MTSLPTRTVTFLFTDIAGSLWLFGGANGTLGGFTNDLWQHVPSQRELYLPMLQR